MICQTIVPVWIKTVLTCLQFNFFNIVFFVKVVMSDLNFDFDLLWHCVTSEDMYPRDLICHFTFKPVTDLTFKGESLNKVH